MKQTQTPDTTKQKELHTQGEWEFDGMELIMCGDEVIADIRSCNHDGMEFDGQVFNRSQEEAVANAELIVKAVNEYETLKEARNVLCQLVKDLSDSNKELVATLKTLHGYTASKVKSYNIKDSTYFHVINIMANGLHNKIK